MIDFSKLASEDSSPAPIIPSQIFHSLTRGDRFDYLRDVQGEVLTQWHARRKERDIVIKMNTGSGKTLVGLLMLRTCPANLSITHNVQPSTRTRGGRRRVG